MKNIITKTVLVAFLATALLSGATSCKSKKAAAREKAAAEAQYKSKVNAAKTTLYAILNDETTWSLQEKEAKLNAIKNDRLDDTELNKLIALAEKHIDEERAAAGLDGSTPRVVVVNPNADSGKAQVTETTASRLNSLFDKIASSNDSSAEIAEAKYMFESMNVPVLIIISKDEHVTDYDRPTTIEKYLNYLKDQKVSRNKVYNIKYGENNKINELELIRK